MTQRSTMGAPLTEAEAGAIYDAWAKVLDYVDPLELPIDAVEMLEHITNIILACHSCRMVIGSGWNAANARAFPREQARSRPGRYNASADLSALFGDDK